MVASLKTFKNNMTKGFLGGNKFFFNIQSSFATLDDPRAFKYYCKAIDFPDSSYNTSEIFINGNYRRHAIDRDYDPIMATFYLDNQMSAWQMFNDWHNYIYDHKTRSMSWPDEYMNDTNWLEILSNENEVIKKIKFNKLFPQTIGKIRFDWENENKVSVFDVTFKYTYPEEIV